MSKQPTKRVWDNVPDFVDGIPVGKVQEVYIGKIDLEYNDLEFRITRRYSELAEDIRVHGQQFPVILRGIEHSMSYDPNVTSSNKAEKMLKALKEASEVLEKKLREVG